MKVNATERPAVAAEPDLRSSGELAPQLALPWILRLRYGLVSGETTTILFVLFVLKLDLPVAWLAIPIAVTAATNIVLHVRSSVLRPGRFVGLFVLDTVCLTVLLALTGGVSNPFTLLYLVQITISAVVLDRRSTFGLGILSTVCFGVLFLVYRPLPELQVHHGEGSLHLTGMWVAFATAAVLVSYFVSHVAEELRRREREVIAFQDQLARQEKLASLVTLAAGSAHELGTPLATIAVVSKELEHSARDNPSIAEDARLIRSEVDRCRVILQRMSARGAEQVGETPAPVSIAELVGQTKRQLSSARQSALSVAAAPDGVVTLPVEATAQALAALLNNAFDADSSGRVSLDVEANGGRIRFTVRDHGKGMPPEVLRRVAEPFFTTKAPGAGMGLGVFLVRMFAERMGGNLVYESEPGAGVSVTLDLPVTAVPAVEHASA